MEEFLRDSILLLCAFLPALTLHEFAHAYSAYRLGDPTAKFAGRVSLNPLAHLDPIGTLMIVFVRIGWARPVPVNPANFRDPAKGVLITSAVGPGSNIAQGVFWGLVLRLGLAFFPTVVGRAPLLFHFLLLMTQVNFILAIFNLIPLGPLDGHSILEYFLPFEARMKYRQFNQYGFAILIGVIFFSMMAEVPIFGYVIFGPAAFLAGTISGVS